MPYLSVKVIPRSAKTELVDIMADGTLKIRLKAQPEKGQANQELLKFLAQNCQCASSELKIISGQQDRHKLISLPANAQIPTIWTKNNPALS